MASSGSMFLPPLWMRAGGCSQRVAMMLPRVVQKHETVLIGPQREDRRVCAEGRAQVRDRPALRGRSRYGQALLQSTRRTRHLGAREGSRQSSEAGREDDQATRQGPPTEAVGHPLPEGRVLVRSVGGEGERSDGLPSGRTPPQEPKKDPEGHQKETSS